MIPIGTLCVSIDAHPANNVLGRFCTIIGPGPELDNLVAFDEPYPRGRKIWQSDDRSLKPILPPRSQSDTTTKRDAPVTA